tara:strand:- start:608 stop:769 length:162 start_codon:yes stop_codon:yes gene_type:complete
MDYTLEIPDHIYMDDTGSLLQDEQLIQFVKVSEEIDPLSELFACAANKASVYS